MWPSSSSQETVVAKDERNWVLERNQKGRYLIICGNINQKDHFVKSPVFWEIATDVQARIIDFWFSLEIPHISKSFEV